MRFIRPFLLAIATLALANVLVLGQAGDEAKRIYSSSQDSVFLVYLNDSSGTPSALGSAFLVAPRILVTNAHVADAGSPVLAVGPVRIPLKILRTDEKNDLGGWPRSRDISKPQMRVPPVPRIWGPGRPQT